MFEIVLNEDYEEHFDYREQEQAKKEEQARKEFRKMLHIEKEAKKLEKLKRLEAKSFGSPDMTRDIYLRKSQIVRVPPL